MALMALICTDFAKGNKNVGTMIRIPLLGGG